MRSASNAAPALLCQTRRRESRGPAHLLPGQRLCCPCGHRRPCRHLQEDQDERAGGRHNVEGVRSLLQGIVDQVLASPKMGKPHVFDVPSWSSVEALLTDVVIAGSDVVIAGPVIENLISIFDSIECARAWLARFSGIERRIADRFIGIVAIGEVVESVQGASPLVDKSILVVSVG